jgi:hypothetical protein
MLKHLSDESLHAKTLAAAAGEKAATLLLLEHLAEVDRRRLYAIRGFSSLWEYVHKALGYSEAQASERVSAMRLMTRVPEAKAELARGELTLTAVSKLASHVRREVLTVTETKDLIAQISGKPTREVERILVSQSARPPQIERITPVSSEATRLTLEVDAEFLALVERFKELRGDPSLGLRDVFQAALAEYVKRREPKAPAANRPAPVLRAPEVNTRYIPVPIRNSVRVRAGDRCEFVDAKSGRRCESRSGLQFDHRRPFAAGGASTDANLRLLCPAHNRLAAIRFFGAAKMKPHLRL